MSENIKILEKRIEEIESDLEISEYIDGFINENYKNIVSYEFDYNMVQTIKNLLAMYKKIKANTEYYDKEIKKIENKKIWNEPCDTIIRNRFVNYFNILQEVLDSWEV